MVFLPLLLGKTRIVPLIDDEHLSDLTHLLGTRRQGVDMYGTISIDEMQEVAMRKLGE